MSAGILVLLLNLTALAMISFPAGLGQTMNWIYLGAVFLCILLMLCVREQYLRPSDDDARSRPLNDVMSLQESAGQRQVA